MSTILIMLIHYHHTIMTVIVLIYNDSILFPQDKAHLLISRQGHPQISCHVSRVARPSSLKLSLEHQIV